MAFSVRKDAMGESDLSRRSLLKKGALAGGLVWAAPAVTTVLATAQAQPSPPGGGGPCCPAGTPITVKVAEQTGVNCGVACMSMHPAFNFDCPPDLVDCLGQLELIVADFNSGGADTAIITLGPGVSLISTAAKAGNRCYFADCPCFAASQTDATCPNTCQTSTGSPCTFTGGVPPLPPAPGGVNRIWVVPNSPGAGETTIFVNTHPDGQLNHVELSVCVSDETAALCP